ncbi:DUF192 domain-containing protein [Paenibacillus koleovorans]|uniref:DUF192 domain-containing protein n=1 Tax=Paenibacillus koleovorans TaxID=121608 RepID=UPI000FD9BA62|nr:DUF192 domain-containing protein [Paenibacillus koleovorans]
MKLIICSDQQEKYVASRVTIADTFISRLKGWLGKNQVHEEEALIIRPCSSVHTFGMKMAIDVLFLDSSNQIIYFIQSMRPNRIGKHISGSKQVIELREGTIQRLGIKMQDYCLIKDAT